jgi:hypothetical protein
MVEQELKPRKGKQCTKSLYRDARLLLEKLDPEKDLVTRVFTLSFRDFLWSVIDQSDFIDAQKAEIIAAEARGMENAANIADELAERYAEPTQRDYDKRDGAIEAATAIRAALNGGQHDN